MSIGIRYIATINRTWLAWKEMHHKCYYPTYKMYFYYGQIGFRVCPEWSEYDKFVDQMERCPPYKILRIREPSRLFCKDNCYWG